MSDMGIPIQIGYVCSHGHYCFYADPDENGQCGSKSVGRLMFIPDDPSDDDLGELIGEASQHLGEVFETWRSA